MTITMKFLQTFYLTLLCFGLCSASTISTKNKENFNKVQYFSDVVEDSNYCEERGPCLNGGTCTTSVDGYQCKCVDPFSGVFCEVVDLCVTQPCRNGGNCSSDSDHAFQCSCPPNWTGSTCETDELSIYQRTWETVHEKALNNGNVSIQIGRVAKTDVLMYQYTVRVRDPHHAVSYPPCGGRGATIRGIQVVNEIAPNPGATVSIVSGGFTHTYVTFDFELQDVNQHSDWTIYLYGANFL